MDSYDAGLAEHRLALFEHFQQMVGVLARSHPDVAIVVRPHPSEDHDVWHEAGGGRSNVHVVHEGNAAPWLLAADAMIHNGCTTALERYLLGAPPAIVYQPVVSEHFEKRLPNGLSISACDLGGLLKLVSESLEGARSDDLEGAKARRELISRYVSSLEGPFASERIAESLVGLADGRGEGPVPKLRSRLARRATESRRRLGAGLRATFDPERDELRSAYYARLFPDVSTGDLETSVDRFRELLGRFSRVRIRRLHERIFEISASQSRRSDEDASM